MKITIYHNGVLPVLKYGGTERIIYWLMKELSKKGHQVNLIADKESKVSDIGVKLIPLEKDKDWRSLIPKDTDIVNLFFPTELELDYPVVFQIGGK
jgi:hypothetical protein